MDDRELMGIRVDTLFTHDAAGRMVRSNEPNGGAPPSVFLGATSDGFVVRFGETVPDEAVQRVNDVLEHVAGDDAPRICAAVLSAVRGALERHAPIAEERGGPAYRFPDWLETPEQVVQVTEANLEVAQDTYPWLLEELRGWWPCFAVLCDGAAVSVCFSSRIGAAAAEAGVDTLPAFRGRGYAAAVTTAWGASIRESGRIPLYSTAWGNVASRAVAGKVGLIMFGEDMTWTQCGVRNKSMNPR